MGLANSGFTASKGLWRPARLPLPSRICVRSRTGRFVFSGESGSHSPGYLARLPAMTPLLPTPASVRAAAGSFALRDGLPLVLAFAPRGVTLAFAPEDGSTLSKELEIDLTFNLEDIAATADGEELPSEMLMGEVDEGILVRMAISVTDEFVETAEGKHVELLRAFDDIEFEGGAESETEVIDDFDGLVEELRVGV